MRELWARRIVLFTALIVILLAIVFARIQNPADSKRVKEQHPTSMLASRLPQAVVLDKIRVEAGRNIYTQQNCSLCHSISGEGNPYNPLDSVGKKRSVNELRQFITGADSVQALLPENVKNFKQRYKNIPEDELDALIVYMQSLRS